MSQEQWNPLQMLIALILLSTGKEDLDSWLERLGNIIRGTTNSVMEMQNAIDMLNAGINQLLMPQSNTPQDYPGAEPQTDNTTYPKPEVEYEPPSMDHSQPDIDKTQTDEPAIVPEPEIQTDISDMAPKTDKPQITVEKTAATSLLPINKPQNEETI